MRINRVWLKRVFRVWGWLYLCVSLTLDAIIYFTAVLSPGYQTVVTVNQFGEMWFEMPIVISGLIAGVYVIIPVMVLQCQILAQNGRSE